jgi:hypothetical protein
MYIRILPLTLFTANPTKMKFVLTGFCLLTTMYAFSQSSNAVLADSLKARYNHETLHFFKGYLSKGENGERVRFSKLKNQFNMSPEGAKEFAVSQKSRKTALLTLGGAFTCIVTAAIINKSNRDLSRGLLVGGLAFDIISIPFSIKSGKRLQHAIWLRNRDVVFH